MRQPDLVIVTLVGRVELELFDSRPRLLAVASDCLMDALSLLSMLFNQHLVSSAYLRLLIFLPAILIPASASSSPAFKQGDNIQP